MRGRWANFLFLLVLVPIAGVVWYGFHRIEGQTRSDLESELEIVLATTRSGLRVWAQDRKSSLFAWSESDLVRKATGKQLEVPRTSEALRRSPMVLELRRILQPVIAGRDYIGFAIIAGEGTEIAGTSDQAIGTRWLAQRDPSTIRDALAGKVTLGLPFRMPPRPGASGEDSKVGMPVMLVAAPVRDSSGVARSVLVFLLDPSQNFSYMAQLGRTGKTGETYLFNRSGRFITQSRFDGHLWMVGLLPRGESAILGLEIRDPGGNMVEGFRPKVPRSEQSLTKMARSATAGETGVDLDGYRDYRGVPVVGTWTWDEQLGAGITTEIDYDEAYRSLRITRWLVFFMLGVTAASALLVAGVLRRQAKALARVVALEQAAVRARDDFLSVASHELKTPLTSLRLQVERLDVQARGLMDGPRLAKMIANLQVIGRQIDRMTQLINDLLDVTRITSGGPLVELEDNVDLAAVVRDVAARMKDDFERAACALELRSPGAVVGRWDPRRLEQIATNLLSNAVKYGGGKPVEVELKADDSKAVLQVQDHGIGVPPEKQTAIFERFERAVSGRDYGGLGLGLWIVRQIVIALHGEVTLVSRPGEGSTFTVVLPRRPPKIYVAP